MWKTKFIGDGPRFVEHDAVRLEDSIDVPGRAARVVGQSHRCPAKDVDIRNHAPLSKPVAQPVEGIFDRSTVQQWVIGAHATFNSWAAT
ncbi:hypothetical protein OG400_33025 [Micromonospora ureilytica]|uniref:hypothetical protein n=1 Tax=Micromonospora ureilytica TaxID=709868 RepID=UPI002E15D4D2|nr:hypothetical protein OG400_33025 [Micromonospora ureilytica]